MPNENASESHRLLSTVDTRKMLGGISKSTFWRLTTDPAQDFPRSIYISRRPFWKAREIADWIDQRTEKPRIVEAEA